MTFTKGRLGKINLILLIGISIWLYPTPDAVDPKAWGLMAIFASTVIGLIISPYPLGAMAIFSLTVSVAAGLVGIKEILAGFSEPIIWMIACAFFISRGFIKTGFGRRVGYFFIRKFGHSSLGLAYGLILTDLIFAPAMPSTSARCGGIVTPIFRSISEAYGSTPEKGTERQIGAFLMQCVFQCNAITCAMFLTSMAGNPMIAKLASEMGMTITWGSWALAASVPGIISLVIIPLLLYRFYPPVLKKTPEMRAIADKKLKEMGSMSRHEWVVLGVFICLIVLWVCGATFNIDATLTAFIGLTALLLTGTLTWDDVVAEKEAWHAMIWFSVLLTMASQLNKLGLIKWLGEIAVSWVDGMNWIPMLGILLLAYYYIHYFMASAIAHISAMYAVFVSIAISAGAPPMLSVLVFGVFSNLYMATTHYSGGPAPILFGCNYVPLSTWWKVGFLLSLVIIPVWLIIGGLWWKMIGHW